MPHTPTDSIALVLLNNRGLAIAKKLQDNWPGAEIYGLNRRVDDPDTPFENTAETLQALYQAGTPVVGVCASGILIRALAPVISDKRIEPPVLAMSDDGRVVVPLLGGLTGANELTVAIAKLTGGTASLTASGFRQFAIQLEAPPDGYTLANPENAKRVTSDLLSGASVRVDGGADFVAESGIPVAPDGDIPIQVTIHKITDSSNGLIYHPRSIAVHMDPLDPVQIVCARQNIEGVLDDLNITSTSVGALLLTEGQDHSSIIWDEVTSIAKDYRAPIRYIANTTGLKSHARTQDMDILEAATPDALTRIGRPHGDLAIVGVGPGDRGYLTKDARDALANAEDLVGYETYLDLVPDTRPSQVRHASGNRVEIERAQQALDLAVKGRRVALVTSGDPGIFAMASAVMETLETEPGRWTGLDIAVIPGISAMQTAAARIGAPLGHDFCTISLSDIRKPWDIVARRLYDAA
ncbi:MAG: SAM-dependent methyltransferase, partial [Methyloligellaceae bacterium]